MIVTIDDRHQDLLVDYSDAVLFFLNQLIAVFDEEIDHEDTVVNIIVHDRPSDYAGYIEQSDDNEYDITIFVSSDGTHAKLTLAHETIHLFQYLTGMLDNETRIWRGPEYDQQYENQYPQWELQAYQYEKILHDRYINR